MYTERYRYTEKLRNIRYHRSSEYSYILQNRQSKQIGGAF